MTIPTISGDELLRKIEKGDPFVLVDALPPMSYAHSHLPGAINLPPSAIDPSVARRIPDSSTEIVVYCTSVECEDSVMTAERLRALGYTNIHRYPGGKNEWRATGRPLERAGRPFTPT